MSALNKSAPIPYQGVLSPQADRVGFVLKCWSDPLQAGQFADLISAIILTNRCCTKHSNEDPGTRLFWTTL